MNDQDFSQKIAVIRTGVDNARQYLDQLQEDPEHSHDIPGKMQEFSFYVNEIRAMHPFVKTLDKSQSAIYRQAIGEFQDVLTKLMHLSNKICDDLGFKAVKQKQHTTSAKAYTKASR